VDIHRLEQKRHNALQLVEQLIVFLDSHDLGIWSPPLREVADALRRGDDLAAIAANAAIPRVNMGSFGDFYVVDRAGQGDANADAAFRRLDGAVGQAMANIRVYLDHGLDHPLVRFSDSGSTLTSVTRTAIIRTAIARVPVLRRCGSLPMKATANESYDLDRFVEAQRDTYDEAIGEIRSGRKRSHWMWFVFPQIAGLGMSETSRRYAIRNRAEAEAYLAHPVLGPRLLESAEAVLALEGRSALDVFGSPDDMKLRSCATLFAAVSAGSVFERVLDRYFGGEADARTLSLLHD
jgi:uncharacterized protein (DUF1810 family)